MTTYTQEQLDEMETFEMSELWKDAEATARQLQENADVMGLPEREWLYRQGLADQARQAADVLWTTFDARMMSEAETYI